MQWLVFGTASTLSQTDNYIFELSRADGYAAEELQYRTHTFLLQLAKSVKGALLTNSIDILS